jgi:hypothetical protein
LPNASFGGGSLLCCVRRPFSIEEDNLGFRKAFFQILGAEVIFAAKLIKANLAIPEEK